MFAANADSTPARSSAVQSPAMYASPKPIVPVAPSREKNACGRTRCITGAPDCPPP